MITGPTSGRPIELSPSCWCSRRTELNWLRSYELQANCYITKPVDLEQFITVVKSIEDFWFTIVTLPHIT